MCSACQKISKGPALRTKCQLSVTESNFITLHIAVAPFSCGMRFLGRSRWPRGLRRGSAAARLWVRIPPGARMSVCVSCECCVLSVRGTCDRPTTRPQEYYWMWSVWVWSWNLSLGCLGLGPRGPSSHKRTVSWSHCIIELGRGKGKTVLLQAWSGQEGSSKLRFPDFMTTAQDGGKLYALTPRKCAWFLLEAESTPVP